MKTSHPVDGARAWQLFRQNAMTTYEIAKFLGVQEHEVVIAMAVEKDKREVALDAKMK